MREDILVINPGSTSTKIALYRGAVCVWSENITHSREMLERCGSINGQLDMRRTVVRDMLAAHGTDARRLSAVVARGGLLPPVRAGAYRVNKEMLTCLAERPRNQHASNLGAALAADIAAESGSPAMVYDPVTVDEMLPITRITGLRQMRRVGMGHNLNMRATALRYAAVQNRRYTELNLIVAHLGGGITLSLHSGGRIIDMISDDEGPFSPERAGGLPCFQVAELICRDGLEQAEVMQLLQRRGGLVSLLGTSDAEAVERRIDTGDEAAKLVYRAMALNIGKNIAKLAVTVRGRVDAVLLTGGMAHSKRLTDWVAEDVAFIAPVTVFPGENEMQALAGGALRVLRGEEPIHEFFPG